MQYTKIHSKGKTWQTGHTGQGPRSAYLSVVSTRGTGHGHTWPGAAGAPGLPTAPRAANCRRQGDPERISKERVGSGVGVAKLNKRHE